MQKKVKQTSHTIHNTTSGHRKYRLYLDSLRLERWPRSLAIIPGFIAYLVLIPGALTGIDVFNLGVKVLVAFLLTLFISTANYIINEIADAPHDAYHPSKKHRPLVKKEISIKILLGMWALLVVVSIAAAQMFYHNVLFLVGLVSLLIAGILYNVPPIRVKDIPYLDSTLESANNPIRFLIGWHILGLTFPPLSLLLSWWAFGNFLMVGKRVAEKKFLTEEESAGYRRSLKKYNLKSLILFMRVNAVVFLGTFAWFAVQSGLKSFLFSIPFIMVYLWMFMKKIGTGY